MDASSPNMLLHWFTCVTSSPEVAAEITVFMTIKFGLMSSVEIFMSAPAFMKRSVIRMRRVPATSMLTLLAKNVLFKFYLNILKMRPI